MDTLMEALPIVNEEDVLHDFRPFFVVYKDDRVQRFLGNNVVPPSIDPHTGVESKDVVISPETGVFVRLYKPPKLELGEEKVPLVVYFHGGAFCFQTAASPFYHSYLNNLSSQANVVVVTVSYRKAPEHPLPTAYEDSWSALDWVAANSTGGGESWLEEFADFSRFFLVGDSAGGNIAHHMAKRLAKNPLLPIKLEGVVQVHPYFWGKDRIGSEEEKTKTRSGKIIAGLWEFVHPGSSGLDDPLINPAMDPKLSELSGQRLLVCVAEKDVLRDRGVHYKETLVKSGWKGSVEVLETLGEDHCFHLFEPNTQKAAEFLTQISAFLNSTPTIHN